jgi:hypothetical protein
VIVFAREVFVCRCRTDVRMPESHLSFRRGSERDLALLDRVHHDEARIAELRERLGRGEHWVIGDTDGRIVTYTWLHTRDRITYPYLPGCTFAVPQGVGYGSDAYTPPELRGGGLRRATFAHELGILKSLGMKWEASFFVKHQLDGATRSLARVGIVIEPLWRVRLAGKTLDFELLADSAITPVR